MAHPHTLRSGGVAAMTKADIDGADIVDLPQAAGAAEPAADPDATTFDPATKLQLRPADR
jgi:hypothetical protein